MAFAQGRNVELVDGMKLNGWIKGVRNQNVVPSRPEAARATEEVKSSDCPLCGKEMVTRTAKQGPNKGNAFWGCSDYPQCRGTSTDRLRTSAWE